MKIWLEENKIFFEVVASVLISVAAFAVSFASYNVTKQQLALTEEQLKVSRFQYRPHFYIEESYLYNKNTNKYYESELKIFNEGSPVHNIETIISSFIRINQYKNGKEFISDIPIIGYYNSSFDSQTPSGEISTKKGKNNNEIFSKLHSEVIKSKNIEKKYGTVEINIYHIVRINFIDNEGGIDSQYFLNKRRVPVGRIKKKLDKHSQNFVEIKTLHANQLLSMHEKFYQEKN